MISCGTEQYVMHQRSAQSLTDTHEKRARQKPSNDYMTTHTHLDLILVEQGGGAGSPEQLTEAVFVVLLQQATLERP